MEKNVASGGQGTKNKNLCRNTKNRDKDDKLEQNRNKGAVAIVENKGCLGVGFQVNENHVTNSCVERKRLKIAKPEIVDPCELGDTKNVSLTSEMACDYKRGNFKAVIYPPMFITNSVDLMNHSEAQKRWLKLLTLKTKSFWFWKMFLKIMIH